MKVVISLIFTLLFSTAMTGCEGDSPSDGDADGDADGDSDGDADGDSDGDADGDSDGDSDGDADGDSDGDADGDWPIEEFADPVIFREDGWLRGDLHQHTIHSDGDDPISTVIRIAEYLVDPEFTERHPAYVDNGIDFMAITDHRTIDGLSDPEFVSDSIILIPGEEFGSTGHAGVWGLSEFVDHDPDGDGVSLEDIQSAIAASHSQDALFSPNHPFLFDIPFPWDVRDFDAVEIWNAPWAVMAASMTEEHLLAWEDANGPASPLFWRAIQDQGRGKGMQALTWYEAMLSRGIHTAIVGGSDRHTVLMMAFPTTYVLSDEATVDGIIDGIRARHTFVARNPVAVQMVMDVTVGDQQYMMGDVVPIPEEGAEVTISTLVGRANGGLLQLISGGAVESDEALIDAPLGEIVFSEDLDEDREVVETTLTVHPGDWLYPMVFEPLYRPDITDEQRDIVDRVTVSSLATGGEDFAGLVEIFVGFVNVGTVLGIDDCLVEEWDPLQPRCLPVDDNNMGTIFIPDFADRAINVVSEDNEPTEWTMGAVGSAVMFVAE